MVSLIIAIILLVLAIVLGFALSFIDERLAMGVAGGLFCLALVIGITGILAEELGK